MMRLKHVGKRSSLPHEGNELDNELREYRTHDTTKKQPSYFLHISCASGSGTDKGIEEKEENEKRKLVEPSAEAQDEGGPQHWAPPRLLSR